MLNSKTILSKLIGASIAMVVFFGLTAQSGEKRVKKLYEKKEAEEALKQAQVFENMEITDNQLRNIINAEAKKTCNEEIAKQRDPRLGGAIITSKPINVIIDECVRQKTPEMWKRRYEFKENFQKEMKNTLEEVREMLTLEGCRKFAEKDKDCTDDLIVKFDRFGTCTCEIY